MHFSDGSDIEIFDFRTLRYTNENVILPSDKEHVTKYMWEIKKFKCKRIDNFEILQIIDIL